MRYIAMTSVLPAEVLKRAKDFYGTNTRLEVGEHTVRFVDPEERSKVLRIEVEQGAPTRWFVNWVKDYVRERPLEGTSE